MYMKSQKELDVIYDYKTDRIILRSKANSMRRVRNPLYIFFFLEKNNKARTHMRKLPRHESSTEEIIDPKIIHNRN